MATRSGRRRQGSRWGVARRGTLCRAVLPLINPTRMMLCMATRGFGHVVNYKSKNECKCSGRFRFNLKRILCSAIGPHIDQRCCIAILALIWHAVPTSAVVGSKQGNSHLRRSFAFRQAITVHFFKELAYNADILWYAIVLKAGYMRWQFHPSNV